MKNAPTKSTKSNPALTINVRLKTQTLTALKSFARREGLTLSKALFEIVKRQLPRLESGEIPLPKRRLLQSQSGKVRTQKGIIYMPQIIELVYEYGQFQHKGGRRVFKR